jgi:hypothetical protein
MVQTKLAVASSYEDILSFPVDDRHFEIIEGAGTPFNQTFSWCFQAEMHDWNCGASWVPRTS